MRNFYFGIGPVPDGIGFSKIPGELLELNQRLKCILGKEHDAVFKIDVHQRERFPAKVALGLGGLMLNDSFQTSQSAKLLRDY